MGAERDFRNQLSQNPRGVLLLSGDLNDEHQRARRLALGSSACTVRKISGNRQENLGADLLACKSKRPALDDLVQAERSGLAPIIAGVKLGAVFPAPASVVGIDRVSVFQFLTRTLGEDLNRKACRGISLGNFHRGCALVIEGHLGKFAVLVQLIGLLLAEKTRRVLG